MIHDGFTHGAEPHPAPAPGAAVRALAVHSVTPEAASRHQVFAADFRERLTATATASEAAGWAGILVPHNLQEVDPWMVASYLGAVTRSLVPLLAVQPACIPPHTAAACVAAYATLYGRPLNLNLVIGARGDELGRIGDRLDHDGRYGRLLRYGQVVKALLRGETLDGDDGFWAYRRYRLEPRPEAAAGALIFVAGSSPASLLTARRVADVVVTHPAPFADWLTGLVRPLREEGYTGELGIRMGVICRPDREEAWHIARERYPESWGGRQETLLKTRSQNVWSRELAQRAVRAADGPSNPHDGRPYWLGAFSSALASAPFLVGDYGEVAAELARYAGAGAGHLLLDAGRDEDFPHVRAAVDAVRIRLSATEPADG